MGNFKKNPLDIFLTFRLNQQERDALEAAAKRNGFTLAEQIRFAILKSLDIAPDPEYIAITRSEKKRIETEKKKIYLKNKEEKKYKTSAKSSGGVYARRMAAIKDYFSDHQKVSTIAEIASAIGITTQTDMQSLRYVLQRAKRKGHLHGAGTTLKSGHQLTLWSMEKI